MKNMKKISFWLLVLVLVSCASRKDIIYLQDLEGGSQQGQLIQEDIFKHLTLKPDDRITINISSYNLEAAMPYNLPVVSFNTGGQAATAQQQMQSYLVNKDGNINFPQLGEVNVLGKTRNELEVYLEKKIKPFLPDAKANVQLVNFRVSILGEVSRPASYTVNRERISVLQAIAMAGDLTIHGKRDEIIVMREKDGGIKSYTLDIRSSDLMKSPAFYLQQNDILYVKPNKPRVNAAISSPTNSYIISATGLLITIISLLTR